jgi:hypothetical protein
MVYPAASAFATVTTSPDGCKPQPPSRDQAKLASGAFRNTCGQQFAYVLLKLNYSGSELFVARGEPRQLRAPGDCDH